MLESMPAEEFIHLAAAAVEDQPLTVQNQQKMKWRKLSDVSKVGRRRVWYNCRDNKGQ